MYSVHVYVCFKILLFFSFKIWSERSLFGAALRHQCHCSSFCREVSPHHEVPEGGYILLDALPTTHRCLSENEGSQTGKFSECIYTCTVFPHINAGAFIFYLHRLDRHLFKAGVLKETLKLCFFTYIVVCAHVLQLSHARAFRPGVINY